MLWRRQPFVVMLMVKNQTDLDFPGNPVVKTPRFQSRGHRFDPWWGKIPCDQKKKKKKKTDSVLTQ